MQKYTILYQNHHDPDKKEQLLILNDLKNHNINIKDSFLGNILVEGEKEFIFTVVEKYQDWKIIEVQKISLPSEFKK